MSPFIKGLIVGVAGVYVFHCFVKAVPAKASGWPVRGLLAAALVEVGLVTYRALSSSKILPPPSDYVAVAIIYGGLGLLPESGANFASLVGWGLVVATLLNLWSPATPTKLAVYGKTTTVPAGNPSANTPKNPYSLTNRGTGRAVTP